MAEIEHFVNENDKNHTKFSQVADLRLNLFPQVTRKKEKADEFVYKKKKVKVKDITIAFHFIRVIYIYYCVRD